MGYTTKYRYAIEFQIDGTPPKGDVQDADGKRWTDLLIYHDVSLPWAQGWLDCYRDREPPKLAVRLMRYPRPGGTISELIEGARTPKPHLVSLVSPNPEVGIGMVAGFPTPAQYRAAAARAIGRAEQIEVMMVYSELRRGRAISTKQISEELDISLERVQAIVDQWTAERQAARAV